MIQGASRETESWRSKTDSGRESQRIGDGKNIK